MASLPIPAAILDELATLRAGDEANAQQVVRCGPGFTATGGRAATGPYQASRTLYVSTTISVSSLS